MKVTEIRLAKLFSTATTPSATSALCSEDVITKAEEDRMSKIGAHLTKAPEASPAKPSQIPTRTRPPITTHVLDVARGSPAAGIEVHLEMRKTDQNS
ncbi:hypothetical protein LguiB_012636 [Lonicera macranthoides]